MTADEIREMHWSNAQSEYENVYALLREIAAQLAEIRGEIIRIGPDRAPRPKSPK